MADILDLIKHANEGKPVDFSSAFSDIIGQKTVDVIDQVKQQVAIGMFNEPEQQELETEIDNGESYENAQTD